MCVAIILIQFSFPYLQEVKFGYIKKSSRDFEEECCHIEELEGKVHVNVADLSKFDISHPSGLPDERTQQLLAKETVDLTAMQYDKGHNNWQQRRPRSPSTCERKPKVPKIEPPEVIVVDDTKECCVQKSQTCDVGITADISSEARFILHEINALQEGTWHSPPLEGQQHITHLFQPAFVQSVGNDLMSDAHNHGQGKSRVVVKRN
ncbi:hypothetical protein E2C01_038448 [Portunus trituberculatus]|uniref:Uncharacterized protein n=1 Tax=Portunus trituberculatus TaxID=210409 RepID=A0A5B7FIJ9_PORTR|nr:hypothetical protein [Portunus trituberculatus]